MLEFDLQERDVSNCCRYQINVIKLMYSFSLDLPGSRGDFNKPGTCINPIGSNQEGINQASVKASFRSLAGRSVARERLLSKQLWKPWRCGQWPHLDIVKIPCLESGHRGENVGSARSQAAAHIFVGSHNPTLHPPTLKHISNQEHNLAEEYRSDDERHVALLIADRSLEKCTSMAKVRCYFDHSIFGTETDGNTNIPLRLFHRTL
ncbi:hypothetical protein TNCV_3113261 [Trichonephila clavipes]|nr:hypothetical protein TNCV_3113261 [Trichonephila clavipes]